MLFFIKLAHGGILVQTKRNEQVFAINMSSFKFCESNTVNRLVYRYWYYKKNYRVETVQWMLR